MGRWRVAAAALSVVVSAAAGVVTNVVTDDGAAVLWVVLGVLVILGVALQIVVSVTDGSGGGAQVAKASGGATIVQAGRDVIGPLERDGRD
jgi:uncharacterized membrane protein HdeD (DUF308 family)